MVFGPFERVYSSVEVTGTETELKGSKTISLEGERESDERRFLCESITAKMAIQNIITCIINNLPPFEQ